jgi:hypothetical protein
MITSCLPGVSIPGNSAGQNGFVKVDDTATGCEDIPPQNAADSEGNSVLNIEIHVDGSGSMLGYVTIPNSRYSKTLEAVDQAFSLSSSNPSQSAKVSYFRTGYNKRTSQSLQPLDRSQFQKSRKAEFYTGKGNPSFPPISSQMNKAIESLSSGGKKLIVLVGDMGQYDGDVTSILETIQNHVFLQKENNKTDNSVAIVGIKSEFDGKVYSPSDPTQYFSYSTTGKDKNAYRPFYLLIAGSSSDVRYFLNKLEVSLKSLIPDIFQVPELSDSKKNINLLESSLFYPNLLPTLTFKNATVDSDKKREVREIHSLQNKDLNLKLSPTSQGLQIRTNKPVSQHYEVSLAGKNPDFSKLANPILPLSLDAKSSAQAFNPSSGTFIDTTDSSSITMSNLNLKASSPLELSFDLNVDPTSLIASNIYLYQFRFRAKELTQPEWWKEWDSADQDSENGGDKTYKLFSFLTGLNTLTSGFMETGELCYAVQRK